MTIDDLYIQGGGGITHGEGVRPAAGAAQDPVEMMRSFRRRWASGVAILTTGTDHNWRGITLNAVMPVSLDPPLVAAAVAVGGEFVANLHEGRSCAVSILQRSQVFIAERFAGRAPLPDRSFTGVPYDLDDAGVPLIRGAAGSLSGRVTSLTPAGDHVLVMLEAVGGAIGPDDDDPLISYEGGYRGLEVD